MENMTVLIVDDDAFMISLTSRILKTLGIEAVQSANDGREALAKLDETVPHIVLCDLNMPGMDGLEFLRHLAERGSECAVILISGEDKRVLQTAAQLAEAHQLRILGSLQKPVKPEPLKVLLEKFDGLQNARKRQAMPLLPVDEVRLGLAGDCVTVFFQPKVSIVDRTLIGVEALVRWQTPDGRILPPVAFLPVIEANDLMGLLTEKVFAKAVAAAADWCRNGVDIKLAVNFSVDTLTRFELVDFIVGTAQAHEFNPENLIIEVTESRIMEDVVRPLEILTRLRMKGIGLSIDDFGTGASSLQQLKRVPFTELKIDRAFVSGAPRDEEARAMLEASVALARRLDLSIVAEGVETEVEWTLVQDLGVDMVQGYFVAKPMPASDLFDWARKVKTGAFSRS